jgi:hypothetical protein
MNHEQHDDHEDHEEYEAYEEYDEDASELSDRDADLADVRDQVAELTAGHTVLELSGEDGRVPALPEGAAGYTAVVAEFCWSRLKREEQDAFLGRLRKAAAKDALLVLLDDVYVEGTSNPVARTDAQGNTYEVVATEDGSRIERPKSYPTDSALRKRLGNAVKELRIARWEYFWVLTGRLK